MRLSSLLLVLSSGTFIGLGLHAVASDRTYDRSIEQTVLSKLKSKVTADLRGTIDFQVKLGYSQNLVAKKMKPVPQKEPTIQPKTKQALSKPEPIVKNNTQEQIGIDRTLTGSIAKPNVVRAWDRFDKDGNIVDPYNPGR